MQNCLNALFFQKILWFWRELRGRTLALNMCRGLSFNSLRNRSEFFTSVIFFSLLNKN